jgi:hypothetical protein
MRGQGIGSGRSADAQIDSSGCNRLKHAKLLGNLERRVMGQHHAGAADADASRRGGDRGDQDFRRRADDAGTVMVFGDPKAVVAENIAAARQSQ